MDEILANSFIYIDTSTMGAGKTYIVLKYAQKYKLPVFIICPKTIIQMWYDTCNQYSVDVVEAMSYEALAGRSNTGISHGWLARIETPRGRVSKDITFYPTQKFCELVKSGMILVFDEFHKVKNENTYTKSVRALIRPVQYGGHSRVALLSGTPFDKVPLVLTLLRTIGLINYDLTLTESGATHIYGAGEIFDLAKHLDKHTFAELRTHIELNQGNIVEFIFQVYVRILRLHLTGGMKLPPHVLDLFDIKNGFYNINSIYYMNIQSHLAYLEGVIAHYGERLDNLPPNISTQLFTTLNYIERGKTLDFTRVAKTILFAEPHSKVIIALNYRENSTIVKKARFSYHSRKWFSNSK